MTVTTAVAIYFMLWWVVLFAVLPWGVRSQEEQGEVVSGTDPGAPAIPRLGRKLIWTTMVSGVIFAVLYVIHVNAWITFDDLAAPFNFGR